MDFNYSENQQMIAETIADFSSREIRPNFMDWDERQYFPLDLFKKLGSLGMLGVLVPAQYGGSGLGYNEYVIIISEIAKMCGSIGLSVAAHNSLCVGHILKFGTEAQKLKWLPKLSNGDYQIIWNGKNNFEEYMPSGMYLYKLKSKNHLKMKKMILMK